MRDDTSVATIARAPPAAESGQVAAELERTRSQRAAYVASVAAGRHDLDQLEIRARRARPRRLSPVIVPPPARRPPPARPPVGDATRPYPVRCDEIRDPEQAEVVQRLRCHHRPACLTTAAKAVPKWEAMSCEACHAYRPMTEVAWRAEVLQLARFGSAIFRCRVAELTIQDCRAAVEGDPRVMSPADDMSVQSATITDECPQ